MWLAPISSEVKEELGDDSILYQKALRNMAEGYGIGACAYLRRLLEKHINPLLQLLHDVKKGQGASDEELEEIRETIMVKDFATKTKFAADIAPLSVMIEGHNPLKEIHQRLSIGLHTLDEETANEYAIAIHTALEFIIKRLRREYEERKVYAEETKKVRRLPVL
jgi:pterin-4a-carbinolamine dehydratase